MGGIAVNRPTGFAGVRPFHLRGNARWHTAQSVTRFCSESSPHQLHTGIWLWCSLKCRAVKISGFHSTRYARFHRQPAAVVAGKVGIPRYP